MNASLLTSSHWRGRPIEHLTRDELTEALAWAAQELERQRAELLAFRPYIDFDAYVKARMGVGKAT
jgi:hypothetical protein